MWNLVKPVTPFRSMFLKKKRHSLDFFLLIDTYMHVYLLEIAPYKSSSRFSVKKRLQSLFV